MSSSGGSSDSPDGEYLVTHEEAAEAEAESRAVVSKNCEKGFGRHQACIRTS
jgi:hypothetical protein